MRIMRRFRKKLNILRNICSGNSLHHAYHEIVLTRNEYMIQLHDADRQFNLLKLLAFGRKLPDYDTLLFKVGQKYEMLGSFVYATGKTNTAKLSAKDYLQCLFVEFQESFDEVKDRIESMCGYAISDDQAWVAFKRLRLFIRYACPFLACTEIWRADVYRHIIEYVLQADLDALARNPTIHMHFPEQRGFAEFSKGLPDDLKETIAVSQEAPDFWQ